MPISRSAAFAISRPFLAMVMLLLLTEQGRADVVAVEYFNAYPAGFFGGQGVAASGWSGPWTAGADLEPNLTAEIVDTSASGSIGITPTGGTAISGGARALDVYPPATGGTNTAARTGIVATRQLASMQTGTFYAGFVMKWQSGTFNTNDTFALHFTNSATNTANGFNFGYRGLPTAYGVMVRKGTSNPVAGAFSTFASTTNTTTRYLLAKFEKVSASTNYNRVTVWINPGTNSEASLPNGDCQLNEDSGLAAISFVNIRVENLRSPDAGSNGNDKVRLDSLAVATSFIDLMSDAMAARPFIWVRWSEKAGILSKIAAQPWATSVYNALIARVATDLTSHQTTRDTWLRGLPVNWTATPPAFKTVPAYAESTVRFPAQAKFNDAQDCAVLYYLTGNAVYAQLAADVLHNAVKTLIVVAPSTSTGNGGWVIQDDLLKEARVCGPQLPIVYDFLRSWLQTNQVYDVATASMVNFNFTDAQSCFRTYYELCRDHGQTGSNWSALMATTMLNNLLALDNATERAAALQIYLITGSAKQTSLAEDYATAYTTPGSVWPESMQYSGEVGANRSAHMVLLERYDPTLNLFDAYPNLPISLSRLSYMRYPNGEQISFGDGHRESEGEPYFNYEIVYQHAKARGLTSLKTHFGERIQYGVTQGLHNRSALEAYPTLGRQDELLQLLWRAATIEESGVPLPMPRTDTLPHAGVTLQRNLSSNGSATNGLMCFVGGAGFVHSHASGMSMELYGMGQVLGAKSGRTTYGDTDNENYYRVFASNNTVVVNGASRGLGGWSDIEINTVALQSLEPVVGQPGVSPSHSYTSTTFTDNKGTLAEATQTRTMGIVRTSPTTGYYVDIFRSDSSLANEFHDYIYRNVGDTVALDIDGTPLTLTSAPTRFQTDIGDSRDQPGWRYFQDTEVSAVTSANVHARFTATIGGTAHYMEMFMPGSSSREYGRVTSPAIVDAPSPYYNRRAPTLVIRRTGSATNQAFAAIFEPHRGTATSGTVKVVEKLEQAGVIVGMKVNSTVGTKNLVQHVISNTASTNTYTNATAGINCTGRYAVTTENSDGTGSLYLANGTNLAYNGYSITSAATTQAYIEYAPMQEPVVTANGPVTVISPVFITNVDNQSTTAGQSTAAIPFTIGGGAGPASLTLTKASSNPTLLANANVVFGGVGADRTVTLTPTAGQLGTSTVTLDATHSSGSFSDTFYLTVNGTALQTWRHQYFGTTFETTTTSDTADHDGDGLANLIEYAFATSPTLSNAAPITISRTPNALELIYTRQSTTLSELSYTIEWSDSMQSVSWNTSGVTHALQSTNGTLQTMKATIPVPAPNTRRFMRVRVTRL